MGLRSQHLNYALLLSPTPTGCLAPPLQDAWPHPYRMLGPTPTGCFELLCDLWVHGGGTKIIVSSHVSVNRQPGSTCPCRQVCTLLVHIITCFHHKVIPMCLHCIITCLYCQQLKRSQPLFIADIAIPAPQATVMEITGDYYRLLGITIDYWGAIAICSCPSRKACVRLTSAQHV